MSRLKGAYITIYDVENWRCIGVNKKIINQVNAFRKLGVSMNLYCIRGNNISRDKKILKTIIPNINYLNKRKNYFETVLIDINNTLYDFIYIRYPLSSIYFLKFLSQIRIKCKIFVEIATYPYKGEAVNLKRVFSILYDSLLNRFLKKHVDFIITFYGQDQIFSIPTISLGNGIDVSSIQLLKKKKYIRKRKQIHLISVANNKFFHGYDRVIRGMSMLTKGYLIFYHVVGDGPYLKELKRLVSELNLGRYVIFHGYREGKDLDEIYANCDIAIGTLGMFRKGLDLDSSLKFREYCAKGIPFINGTRDHDFPDQLKFILRVDNNNAPISISEVVKFYTRISGHPDINSVMRDYAEKHLDWEAKLERVLEKI